MTRTLTDAAQTQSAATSATPINIVKIEFGGNVGTQFFSDRALGAADASSALNARNRVVHWGRMERVLAEQTAAAVGDCALELADADGLLKGYFDAVEFQRKRVTVYQHFDRLGESDMAPLLVGIINAPVTWSRKSATLRFDITDISTYHRATVGHVADKDTFPLVAERDENAVLPLVFGKVKRSEAVQALAGAAAVLVRACTATDTILYVDDASGFPQNQTIQIRIENELIEGHFAGNRFFVSGRGIDFLSSSTVTRAVDSYHLEDSSLTGEDNEYGPYYIRVTDPGGVTHHRNITYYSADTNRISYYPAILYNNATWTIPQGTTYGITTWARSHPAGSVVYYSLDSCAYILNDAPSSAVYRVEAYGRIFSDEALADGQTNQLDIEGWIPLDPNDYTVNLNDTTTFPALGRAVTTLTLKRNPKELIPRLRDDRLWVDIDGVESVGDGSGIVVENPADVVKVLLKRWVGLTDNDLDLSAFSATATALDGFAMAFTLNRQADGLHLCADLAFQSRCALLWRDGVAALSVLRNCVGQPATTVSTNELAAESLRIGRTDMEQLASEVVAQYRSGHETRAVVLRDGAVEAAFGRRVRALNLWAYNDRRMAVSVARFWLSRWKYLYEEVRLTTFLTSLALQRNDTVELDMADHFAASQRAWVRDIVHQPGHGEAGMMDGVTLGLQLPIMAGCSSTCETECESTGESGCLLHCEIEAESGCWQCETQCEALCELACTTEAELHCIVSDTGGGSDDGCGACETSCETGCEVDCETGCEIACETGCEIACETGCESSCETACETGCETGCEVSCETGCESACETGCEVSCETGCEAACETGCEVSCETGCEAACETGCEATCELSCEATACETGCEVTCELACEATACETGCEVACESGCESSCESGCETGCESGCETGGDIPENTCNSCDPAISDTLRVQASGLAGDFAYANTARDLTWTSGCRWDWTSNDGDQHIMVIYAASYWRVYVEANLNSGYSNPGYYCEKAFRLDVGYGCAPETDAYYDLSCRSTQCASTASCSNSSGATVGVSQI